MNDDTCSHEGCDRPPQTRGMCHTHYAAWRIDHIRRGVPLPPAEPRPRRPRKKPNKPRLETCESCGGPIGSKPCRGMCSACYQRWVKNMRKLGLRLPPIKRERNLKYGKDPKPCINPDCDNLVDVKGARGMCSPCYSNWQNDHSDRTIPDVEVPEGHKWCCDCKQVKRLDEFYVYWGKETPTKRCILCHREHLRKWRRRRDGKPEDWVPPPSGKRPAPVGTIRSDPYGYKQIKLPDHPRASKNGWVRHHIVIAEEKYGIRITNEFTVHHKNGDTQDNRPSNLELRVGKHGKHGDAVDTLLVSDELRERAVEVLRGLGYTVLPPKKVRRAIHEEVSGQLELLDAG